MYIYEIIGNHLVGVNVGNPKIVDISFEVRNKKKNTTLRHRRLSPKCLYVIGNMCISGIIANHKVGNLNILLDVCQKCTQHSENCNISVDL